MCNGIEVTPAPTFFLTDIEGVESIGPCRRVALIEAVNGERRIVAYVVWPSVEVMKDVNARMGQWVATSERAEVVLVAAATAH